MAKASRIAARTAKSMQTVDRRLERIELMLEVMMTPKQQERLEALLKELEPEPVALEISAPEPTAGEVNGHDQPEGA